jgi:4-hydroxy-2-oxoheptanedioate aldolase
MNNHVKEKLSSGKVTVGLWALILNPQSASIVANSGVDWILFDTEHGPPSFETIDALVQATI